MSVARRWGIGLVGVSVALWPVVVVAFLTTRPEDGANIGAGLLLFLAVPCTVTGAVLWAANRRSAQGSGVVGVPPGPWPQPRPAGRNPLASTSLALGIGGFFVSWTPISGSVTVFSIQEVVALALSLAAAILGWVALRRVRLRGLGNRGLALAGLTLGIVDVVFLLPEFPWVFLS